MTTPYKLDKWNSSTDGELNAQNMESKLKSKYGHRCYKYKLPAEWTIGYHTHEETKADAILQGTMEMTIKTSENEENKFILEAGDILYLPANTVHKAKVTSEKECIFYDSFR